MFHPDHPVLQTQVIPIVVGAHLRAELGDRQHANAIRRAIGTWAEKQDATDPPWPLVCSDLWYLNDTELRVQPTICIGHPDVNAATAALSSRLETAHMQDDRFLIQLDTEFVDLKCCIWGVDDEGTQEGVNHFVSGYLPQFLGSIFGIQIR